MRVVFFGTPSFAAQVLEEFFREGIDVVAVISKPDRPKGRSGSPVPTPVKQVVHAFNPSLPLYQPERVSAPEFAGVLEPHRADLFIVVAYGELMKPHLLEMPHHACLNLHASLLPEYRGAAPIQRCLLQGATETGVTVMHMAKKMDAGDQVEKRTVPIGPEETFGELEEALCGVGKQLLVEVIRRLEAGEELPRVPQDHERATFAPKIELEDCWIDWSRPAADLHNLVRGVNPAPGAWCWVSIRGERRRLKILRTRLLPIGSAEPGALLNAQVPEGNLLVAAGSRALELLEVQLEGKKRMSSEELARGLPRGQLLFAF